MNVHIDREGRLQFIHADDLQTAFKDAGRIQIKRASHVEPDDFGRWWADLSPVEGPKLGPFSTRSAALNAELVWLEARLSEGSV